MGREQRAVVWEAVAAATWFESLAVASHPSQRRRAETIFYYVQSSVPLGIRDKSSRREVAAATAPQKFANQCLEFRFEEI